MSKGLFLLKKAHYVLSIQKKTVPLHAFCMVETMHLCLRMGVASVKRLSLYLIFKEIIRGERK
jgi:hypothetical protein